MAWGAAIGAGMSFAGQIMASKREKAALAQQRWAQEQQLYMQERQLDLQREQMVMAHAADNERRAENKYRRQQELINRGIAKREREEQQKLIEEYQEQRLREQQIAIDRQIKVDRAAARQRALELNEFLRNKEISRQERQTALNELAEAKAIASGERDDDTRQYLYARARKEAEREFSTREYMQAKNQAQAERRESLFRNNEIMGQIRRMEAGLAGAAEELQRAPEIRTFSPDDIQSEIDRRTTEYQADVDRAASAVASAGEADLIRTGMDLSTTGENRRADIAQRLARDYQNARNRAYDDSMSYITGQQRLSQSDAQAIQNMRQQQLAEVAGIQGVGLDPMLRMTDARSALTGPAAYLNQVGSGVYDRRLASAGGYRAPIPIGSAIFDRAGQVGVDVGPTQTIPSAAYYQEPDSAILNPYSMTIGDPGAYSRTAAGMSGNILRGAQSITSSADAALRDAQARSSASSRSMGSAFQRFGREAENYDWSKLFGNNDLDFMDNYQWEGMQSAGGTMDDWSYPVMRSNPGYFADVGGPAYSPTYEDASGNVWEYGQQWFAD